MRPVLGRDRDADVVVLVVHDVVAFDRSIDHREVLERLDGGLHEEGHEAELHAVFLLEGVLVFRAQVHHGLEIDLVERGELRLRVLRFEQALGDARAQPRHRHALILCDRRRQPRRAAAGGGSGAACRHRRLGGRLVQILDDVTLGDASIAAEAGIFDGSSCFSSTMRRTEGASLPLSLAAAARRLAAAASGGWERRARRAAALAGADSRQRALFQHGQHLAAGHRGASDDPSSLSTPFTGAGTSSTTLSVSRSARFSSRVTDWPACLCQVTSVASATDSGSCGTLISMAMIFPADLAYRDVAALRLSPASAMRRLVSRAPSSLLVAVNAASMSPRCSSS